jgi:hypothetical protein
LGSAFLRKRFAQPAIPVLPFDQADMPQPRNHPSFTLGTTALLWAWALGYPVALAGLLLAFGMV